jgi:hypothetical protein
MVAAAAGPVPGLSSRAAAEAEEGEEGEEKSGGSW